MENSKKNTQHHTFYCTDKIWKSINRKGKQSDVLCFIVLCG